MKWFKHVSTAMDDLFVRDLERKFGDSGYAFWFKTLELIAAHGKDGTLQISWSNYCGKLNKRRDALRRMIGYCSQAGRLQLAQDSPEFVTITCQKFIEYADNFTKYGRRLRSDFKEPSKQEEEGEEEKKKKEKEIEARDLQILSAWNEFAKKNGLSVATRISPKRKAGIARRAAEGGFDFPAVLAKIEGSDFMLGNNDKGWRVDFDFIFCSPENYIKILEGKYDGRRKVSGPTARAEYKNSDAEKRRLAGLAEQFRRDSGGGSSGS